MRRTPVTELEGSPEALAFTPGVTRDVMNANSSGYLRRRTRRGRDVVVPGLLLAWALLLSHCSALALSPSRDVSQYAHTAWRVRDGFSLGAVFAMAQAPDGYLWLGSEFGLFRFDG